MKIPEINSKVLSVRLEFCEILSSIRDERSLIFFTPVSVSPPPQISRDLRLLKSDSSNKEEEKKERINLNQNLSMICKTKVQMVSRMLFIKLDKACHHLWYVN